MQADTDMDATNTTSKNNSYTGNLHLFIFHICIFLFRVILGVGAHPAILRRQVRNQTDRSPVHFRLGEYEALKENQREHT